MLKTISLLLTLLFGCVHSSSYSPKISPQAHLISQNDKSARFVAQHRPSLSGEAERPPSSIAIKMILESKPLRGSGTSQPSEASHAEPRQLSKQHSAKNRGWALGLLGLGALSTLVGSYSLWTAQESFAAAEDEHGSYEEAKSTVDADEHRVQVESSLEDGQRQRLIGGAALGVGALGLILGAWMLPSDEESATSASSLLINSNGLGWRSRW